MISVNDLILYLLLLSMIPLGILTYREINKGLEEQEKRHAAKKDAES